MRIILYLVGSIAIVSGTARSEQKQSEFLKKLLGGSLSGTDRSDTDTTVTHTTSRSDPTRRRSSSQSSSDGKVSSLGSSGSYSGKRRTHGYSMPHSTYGSSYSGSDRSGSSSSRRSSSSSHRSGSSTIVVRNEDMDRIMDLISGALSPVGTACTGGCAQQPMPVADSAPTRPHIYHSYVGADGVTYYLGTDRLVYYWSTDGKWSIYNGTAATAPTVQTGKAKEVKVVNNYYTYDKSSTRGKSDHTTPKTKSIGTSTSSLLKVKTSQSAPAAILPTSQSAPAAISSSQPPGKTTSTSIQTSTV